jgi:hypothetical protein
VRLVSFVFVRFTRSTRGRVLAGPKMDEVKREWRKLHNEDLNDLYYSSTIVRVIKSRITRWAGSCSTYGGEERRIQGFDGET